MYPHEEPLNPAQLDLLSHLYYEKGNMFGLHKLFDIVQKYQSRDNSVPRIYRTQLQKWLNNQQTAQLFKQPPKRKDTKQIFSEKVGKLFQIDTIVLVTRPYKGF